MTPTPRATKKRVCSQCLREITPVARCPVCGGWVCENQGNPGDCWVQGVVPPQRFVTWRCADCAAEGDP